MIHIEYPKVNYKALEEIYNFHKIIEYSVLLHFLLVFVLTAIFGMIFLGTSSFLTYNFLSEYDSILFMNFCSQIHQLPNGSSSTKESREFQGLFHKNFP